MSDGRARPGPRGRVSAALLGFALLVPAAPAAAHTELESSDPTAGQQLDAPPDQVRLVFTDPVDERFARVAMTPAGDTPQELPVTVDGRVLVAQVPADAGGSSGAWRIDFRVVSADGHPVSGSVPFEVLAVAAPAVSSSPAAAAAVPDPADTSPASAARSTAAGEEPAAVWPWALGGAFLVAGGLLVLRRRRTVDG